MQIFLTLNQVPKIDQIPLLHPLPQPLKLSSRLFAKLSGIVKTLIIPMCDARQPIALLVPEADAVVVPMQILPVGFVVDVRAAGAGVVGDLDAPRDMVRHVDNSKLHNDNQVE